MIIALRIVGAIAGWWLTCGLLALLLCSINEALTSEEYLSPDRSIRLARLEWSKRAVLLWGLVSLIASGWIIIVNGQTLGAGTQPPTEL